MLYGLQAAQDIKVVDPTDIRKLYARKMPCLDRIRDGSKGELGNGCWACAAVARESGGRRIVPLHLRACGRHARRDSRA